MHTQISKVPLLLGVMVSLNLPLIGKTISGSDYKVQPVVIAIDEYGNVDVDYVKSVTLSSKGEGALGGTLTQVAVQGRVEFKDLNYTATADNENYALIANDSNFTEVTSEFILSDVVATKLTFTKEVSPLALYTGLDNDFTTDPIVKAVNAQGLVDVNFSEVVTLGHNGTGVGIFNNNSVIAVNGVATFENLTFNYDTTATIELVANDQDDIDSDLTEALSSSLIFEVKSNNIVVPVQEDEVQLDTTVRNDIVVPVKEDELQWDTTVRFDETVEVEVFENAGTQTATVTLPERTITLAVVSTGAMQGSVESQDAEGNAVSSTLEISATNSNTTLDVQGNVNTVVEVNNGTKVTVTVGADGSVKHEVKTERGLTVAVSTIAGADIVVDTQGNITSTSEVEKNGFKYKAIITTDLDGKTKSKFIRVNLATGEEEDISNTLKESDSYEVGSKGTIIEVDDVVYIKVETSLNSTLVIE